MILNGLHGAISPEENSSHRLLYLHNARMSLALDKRASTEDKTDAEQGWTPYSIIFLSKHKLLIENFRIKEDREGLFKPVYGQG
jgi:hypothetical protein